MTTLQLGFPNLNVRCESCERTLATFRVFDNESAFLVCGACVPPTTAVPAQAQR